MGCGERGRKKGRGQRAEGSKKRELEQFGQSNFLVVLVSTFNVSWPSCVTRSSTAVGLNVVWLNETFCRKRSGFWSTVT